jgi:hypothetical protein
MKKLLIVTTIVLGTFASAGMASAEDVTLGSYTGWAADALSSSSER